MRCVVRKIPRSWVTMIVVRPWPTASSFENPTTIARGFLVEPGLVRQHAPMPVHWRRSRRARRLRRPAPDPSLPDAFTANREEALKTAGWPSIEVVHLAARLDPPRDRDRGRRVRRWGEGGGPPHTHPESDGRRSPARPAPNVASGRTALSEFLRRTAPRGEVERVRQALAATRAEGRGGRNCRAVDAAGGGGWTRCGHRVLP